MYNLTKFKPFGYKDSNGELQIGYCKNRVKTKLKSFQYEDTKGRLQTGYYNKLVKQPIENEFEKTLTMRSMDSSAVFQNRDGKKCGLKFTYLNNPNIQITINDLNNLFLFVNDPNNREFSCSIEHLKFGNIDHHNYYWVKEIIECLVHSAMLPNLVALSFGWIAEIAFQVKLSDNIRLLSFGDLNDETSLFLQKWPAQLISLSFTELRNLALFPKLPLSLKFLHLGNIHPWAMPSNNIMDQFSLLLAARLKSFTFKKIKDEELKNKFETFSKMVVKMSQISFTINLLLSVVHDLEKKGK